MCLAFFALLCQVGVTIDSCMELPPPSATFALVTGAFTALCSAHAFWNVRVWQLARTLTTPRAPRSARENYPFLRARGAGCWFSGCTSAGKRRPARCSRAALDISTFPALVRPCDGFKLRSIADLEQYSLCFPRCVRCNGSRRPNHCSLDSDGGMGVASWTALQAAGRFAVRQPGGSSPSPLSAAALPASISSTASAACCRTACRSAFPNTPHKHTGTPTLLPEQPRGTCEIHFCGSRCR